MLKGRGDLVYLAFLPLLIAAAIVLSYYTWETASRYEQLGESSIAHSTLLLVEEKVDRIEQQIISADNAVFHLVDVGNPDGLRVRWLPLAKRISPSVRAMIIFTEDFQVVDYVARTSPSDAEAFLDLFRAHFIADLEVEDTSVGRLRHLHTTLDGGSYLFSYQVVEEMQERFVLVAHHDTGYLVREELPRLFANEEARGQFNVIDDDHRPVFGEPLREGGDYIVAKRFPTTLYRWRMQVAPKNASLLAVKAREREANKAALISLSAAVLLTGVAFLLYAAMKERRLNALKSDFVANVSHELKTPLSVVRMYGEMLATGRVSEVRQRHYLDTICRESERLSGLIENVLDFSAFESVGQRFAPQETDLCDLIASAVDTARQRHENVTIRTELSAHGPRLALDAQAIMLALINLLDNAAKYGDGSPIEVRLESRSDEVRISVRDHGPGIPKEEARRVFERFYRVRRAGSQVRGSGIGLSLVKRIAEAHGGRAWAQPAPGGGAIVTFSIRRRVPRERTGRTRAVP